MCNGWVVGSVEHMPIIKQAGVVGAAHYLPPLRLSNDELRQRGVDTSHEWVMSRTGIEYRHLVEGETTADMAVHAAQGVLGSSGIRPDQIGLLIVATTSGDHLGFPSTACLVQHRLQLPAVPAFDLGAACSGFVYALSVAHQFIATGQVTHALVIGADALSKWVDWSDRRTCVLFGDGAGAVIMGPTVGKGVMYSRLYANGEWGGILQIPSGGVKSPMSHEVIDKGAHYIQMEGRTVFKVAIQAIVSAIRTALDETGLTWDDIQWFVPHQANQRIIDQVMAILDIPSDRLLSSIQAVGNTSAASIPIELSLASQRGQLNKGDRIMCVGFGAGFTWGVSIFEWGCVV